MVQVPLNIINKEIDTIGELVSITVKSERTYSDWGDETATETATTSIKAIYNVYSNSNVFQKEGNFQGSEITFFFKSNQSGIENGTNVTRANGEVYSIVDTRQHGVEGNIHVIEAVVEKI